MSEPLEPKLLERLIKSPCANIDDLRNNQAVMQSMFQQILAAPFAFISNPGDYNTIVSYEEAGRRVGAPLMYAVSTGIEVAPAAANGFIGVVMGKRAANKKGQNPEVVEERFFIRGKAGQNYDLDSGTVFSYMLDTEGDRIVVQDPLDQTGAAATGADATYLKNTVSVGQQPKLDFTDTATVTWTVTNDGGNSKVLVSATAVQKTVLWGKTQHQWKKDGTISLKAVPGYPGSTTEVGSAFFAKIPNPNPEAFDPNIQIGKYIPYEEDDSGNFVVVGNFLDAKIKSVRMYIGDPDDLIALSGGVNISGWGWMDGTDNASGNGGSAINAKDYYLYNKGSDTDAISSGSDLVAAGSHSHTVTINSNTTGITVGTHPDHTHEVGCAATTKDVPNGGSTYYGLISMTDQHSPSGVFYSGIQKANHTGHGSLDLDHSVSDAGHGHSGSTGSSHSDPAKFRIYVVERLDNSFDTLGI